ncbi:COQ9 family protein [Azospirillum griseum]|uniref:COQ9 family protein n=1 Tax=Azospirillum griseum TaxID=2496639 RepID=A0A3S0JFJ0_9PROT|nr:COQ9 family protein [Azospirillum griseum]RTR16608.1 COQ9 family protein [Azospirillum griseum]
MTIDQLRDELLLATLPNVLFDGWSLQSLRDGAEQAGLDSTALLRAFPGGVADAVAHFSAWTDAETLKRLDADPLDGLKVREKIARAVRTHFEVLEPHREAKRRQLAYLAMPQNIPLGLSLLHATVDSLWFAAGDTATDYNHYTKRALLAAVVSATTFYWLDDPSEDHAESWAFLDRRLADVMRVGKATATMGKLNGLLAHLPSPMRFARQVRQRSAASALDSVPQTRSDAV